MMSDGTLLAALAATAIILLVLDYIKEIALPRSNVSHMEHREPAVGRFGKFCVPLLLAAASIFLWTLEPAHKPVGVHAPAKAAPQLYNVPKTVVITPPKLNVYAQEAKAKLKLPDSMKNDPRIRVLESTRVAADDRPATVTTLTNSETGEVETLVRVEPLPWVALKNTGEIRVDYGIKSWRERAVRLSVKQDVLQVKTLYAGINASLDSDGQVFAGIGVGYRW